MADLRVGLFVQQAGHLVVLACVPERGYNGMTVLEGFGTARMENAAGRRIERTRDFAFQDYYWARSLQGGVGEGHRRK
jgi:hypothetical protein